MANDNVESPNSHNRHNSSNSDHDVADNVDPRIEEDKKNMTPGQRLAAEKAEKASRKAAMRAEREREAGLASADSEIDDDAAKVEAVATDWFEEHGRKLAMLVGAIVVGSAIFLIARGALNTGNAEGGRALMAALEADRAELDVGEPADDASEETAQRLATALEARNEAAFAAYKKAVDANENGESAAWARLALGRLLLEKEFGKDTASSLSAEARAHYEAALQYKDSDEILMRAHEGVGFTYEREEKWSEAQAEFERIRDVGVGENTYSAIADYHVARMLIAQEKTDEAVEKLQAAQTAVRGDDARELPYVSQQVRLRLDELAPTTPTVVNGNPGAFSQQQLEELARRARSKQGAQ